jgi:hypothetical protein
VQRCEIVIQSLCNRCAIVAQSLCNCFEIASQSLRNRLVIEVATVSLYNLCKIACDLFVTSLLSLRSRCTITGLTLRKRCANDAQTLHSRCANAALSPCKLLCYRCRFFLQPKRNCRASLCNLCANAVKSQCNRSAISLQTL